MNSQATFGKNKGLGRRGKLIPALVFALILSLVPGCAKRARLELFAMDTYMELTVYGNKAEEALAGAEYEIKDLDGKLSATDGSSELSRINLSNGEPVSVSSDTAEVIHNALIAAEPLRGALQLTLRPVSLAWGFTTGEYRIPAEEELEELLKLVDDGRIRVDVGSNTVALPDGMALDLGSVAKGYACDIAAAILQKYNVSGFLLNMGSSTIMAWGKKPDGGRWRIAVRDPAGEGYAGVIETYGACVSTSGGRERFFTGEDGNTYCHILDPETGRPVDNGVLAVTVVTESGLWGDALSTALFVMGAEKAEELYNSADMSPERRRFEYLFIMEDGSLVLSPGMEELFTPLGRFAEGGAAQ